MDNFKKIYKILKMLEKAMDVSEVDIQDFSAESLELTPERHNAILRMLIENGYINGAFVIPSLGGKRVKITRDIQITLKGLEYLHDNSLMHKAANIARGAIDIIS